MPTSPFHQFQRLVVGSLTCRSYITSVAMPTPPFHQSQSFDAAVTLVCIPRLLPASFSSTDQLQRLESGSLQCACHDYKYRQRWPPASAVIPNTLRLGITPWYACHTVNCYQSDDAHLTLQPIPVSKSWGQSGVWGARHTCIIRNYCLALQQLLVVPRDLERRCVCQR